MAVSASLQPVFFEVVGVLGMADEGQVGVQDYRQIAAVSPRRPGPSLLGLPQGAAVGFPAHPGLVIVVDRSAECRSSTPRSPLVARWLVAGQRLRPPPPPQGCRGNAALAVRLTGSDDALTRFAVPRRGGTCSHSIEVSPLA